MSTDLAVIEAALKAATTGEWWEGQDGDWTIIWGLGKVEACAQVAKVYRGGDASVIANAPAWLAELADRVKAAEAEVERLARWQSDALPVIDGLQELGRSLGLILGDSVTGPKAHAAAEALKSRAESAEATIARVRELAYESDDGTEFKHDHGPLEGHPGCPACWAHDLLAALSGPESAPESPSSPFPAPEDAPAPAEPTEPILRPTDQRYEPPAVDDCGGCCRG